MIKIGNEKLFTMAELLENLAAYLRTSKIEDIKKGACDWEISAVAGVIGESADFVQGFVTSRREK